MNNTFDIGTPRVIALEIQQQLYDKYDIESELELDMHDRPIIKFSFHASDFIATVATDGFSYPGLQVAAHHGAHSAQVSLPGEPPTRVKTVFLNRRGAIDSVMMGNSKVVECSSIEQLLNEVGLVQIPQPASDVR